MRAFRAAWRGPYARVMRGSVGAAALGLASGALVARTLGVEGRGALALALLVPSLVSNVGDVGLTGAYAYQATRHVGDRSTLARNALWLSCIAAVPMVLAAIAIMPLLLADADELDRVTAAAYAAAYIPLNLYSRFGVSLAQGVGAYGDLNRIRLLIPLTYIMGVSLVAAGSARTVPWFLAANLAATAAAAMFAWVKVFRPLADRAQRSRRAVARRTWSLGWRGHLATLNPLDNLQLDLACAGLILGVYETGLYSIALAGGLVIRLLASSAGMVLVPQVAGSPLTATRKAIFRRVFIKVASVSLGLAAVIAVTVPVVIPLVYGEAFSAAVPITQTLVLVAVLGVLRKMTGDLLRALGRPVAASFGEVAALAVGIPSLVLCMQSPLGLYGAPAGLALGYAAGLGYYVAVLRTCDWGQDLQELEGDASERSPRGAV